MEYPVLRSSLLATAPAVLALPAAPALAQQAEIAEESGNEIVVTAAAMRGSVDAPQPPVLVLDEADIESYGASSLGDLIAAVGPQAGSGRGRGGGHPVILLNGQRISSFREMFNIPPEAIRRMEVLPEEVSLRYGYPPNQRVMNFILRDKFSAKTLEGEYNVPTRGGFAENEVEATLLKFGKTSRLNLHLKATDTTPLSEAERGVIQQPGSAPDEARFRSLVADGRNLSATASYSRGLGADGRDGSLSANVALERDDSLWLSGRDALDNPLTRATRKDTLSGGTALNTVLAGWQFSATLDASRAWTEQQIARRATSLATVGFDQASTRETTLESLVTLTGQPLHLPAGDVILTIKGGYAHTGVRSSDTRTGGARTDLSRDGLSAGFNLGIPLTSRRDDVLAGLGDVTINLSAGIDDLSDFGTLKDWSVGLTWSPTEKLGLQASYIVNDAAPALTQLGNPLVQSFNVPVYDFARGETALVTVTTGGNPALRREKQRDLKLSANWELPFFQRSSLLVEYFRNRSNDVTASFPVLTPDIEAAFPTRVTRDAGGRLVALDRRPVTFAETRAERLRWGINLAGELGKADPAAAAGPPGGARRGPGDGPGSGEARGGGGPGGGVPRMGPGGRGNGKGRWNVSVFHTLRFSESVLVAPGGPSLNLLHGDALSGGGVARHGIEIEGGTFYRGFGLRLRGNWEAPTHLRASGAPGTSDLRFGSVFKLNLRTFVNLGMQKRVIKAVPFLANSRLAFQFDNIFDSRQKVTDAGGAVPLGYQKDILDPRGRMIGVDFRKSF